jgi:hypothetical protein
MSDRKNTTEILISIVVIAAGIGGVLLLLESPDIKAGILAKQCAQYENTALADMPTKCHEVYK